MDNDSLNLLAAALVLAAVIYLFIRVAQRIRKHGGSLTSSMFASTYEFYNKEKKAAIEQMVEQKVRKMEEQENDKPK
ncbi:MAG: hypothetical protein NTX65_06935 [Ignavibacteriales bacterium]|nr:hypothetical protein [Ignavibacteriales bacterium]